MEFSSCYFLAILFLSWLCALENPYCQLHILDIGPAIDKIVVIFCTDWPGTRAAITMTEKGMRGGGALDHRSKADLHACGFERDEGGKISEVFGVLRGREQPFFTSSKERVESL